MPQSGRFMPEENHHQILKLKTSYTHKKKMRFFFLKGANTNIEGRIIRVMEWLFWFCFIPNIVE